METWKADRNGAGLPSFFVGRFCARWQTKSTAKASFVGKQSKGGWCHCYSAITLCHRQKTTTTTTKKCVHQITNRIDVPASKNEKLFFLGGVLYWRLDKTSSFVSWNWALWNNDGRWTVIKWMWSRMMTVIFSHLQLRHRGDGLQTGAAAANAFALI